MREIASDLWWMARDFFRACGELVWALVDPSPGLLMALSAFVGFVVCFLLIGGK